MEHQEIATRAGVHLADLESLLLGKVTKNVAARLAVSSMDIEYFIKGSATHQMTRCLGLQAPAAAEELARAAGTNGATGIVLGLLLRPV